MNVMFIILGRNAHYSVYLGVESDSGDLLAIYEWVLQFKTAKKGAGVDPRRIKQVFILLWFNFLSIIFTWFCEAGSNRTGTWKLPSTPNYAFEHTTIFLNVSYLQWRYNHC